jgi:hypothetical protein
VAPVTSRVIQFKTDELQICFREYGTQACCLFCSCENVQRHVPAKANRLKTPVCGLFA